MFIPIIHHGRCAEWAKSEPASMGEAQTALRNAMWTLAASASAYHLTLRDSLYQRTRQALENLDQRTGSVDNPTATATADTDVVQAWLLLAVHELMCVSFRRAWITAGRAFRLIQLDPSWTAVDAGVPTEMHIDSQHHQAQWIDTEQRRRTFWFAYCLDRLMSIRNGSPPTFGERVRVLPLIIESESILFMIYTNACNHEAGICAASLPRGRVPVRPARSHGLHVGSQNNNCRFHANLSHNGTLVPISRVYSGRHSSRPRPVTPPPGRDGRGGRA